MKRLIENDLKTKMSCCYLFPIVYPKLENEDIKKELLQVPPCCYWQRRSVMPADTLWLLPTTSSCY